MKNIIPKQFRFNGHTVQVRVIQPSAWPHPQDIIGCLDPDYMTIDLRKDACSSVLRQKFLHEVMHLVLLSIDRRLAENERFVEQVSQALNQLGMMVEEVQP
jgi:hypothetical protein